MIFKLSSFGLELVTKASMLAEFFFAFWGVHSKPGCQRHHALEFWMILGSGSTRNYWRIKMTLMGFCMRFCKTSTDLVFVFRIH